MPADTIDEIEIQAYIDGELDLMQQLAVEDHLSRHPILAARVMADFRTRSALQLLSKRDRTLSPALTKTVESIQKRRRPFWRASILGLATVTCTGLLTVLMLNIGPNMAPPPPAYVSLAAASHRSIKDRSSFAVKQPVSDHTQALLQASRIAIPKLPENWHVTDVELLNATAVPAMLIAIQTTEGHDLSILALREPSTAPQEPDTVRNGSESVAYWSKGDFSYALTGEGDPKQIDATADALANSWRT